SVLCMPPAAITKRPLRLCSWENSCKRLPKQGFPTAPRIRTGRILLRPISREVGEQNPLGGEAACRFTLPFAEIRSKSRDRPWLQERQKEKINPSTCHCCYIYGEIPNTTSAW